MYFSDYVADSAKQAVLTRHPNAVAKRSGALGWCIILSDTKERVSGYAWTEAAAWIDAAD